MIEVNGINPGSRPLSSASEGSEDASSISEDDEITFNTIKRRTTVTAASGTPPARCDSSSAVKSSPGKNSRGRVNSNGGLGLSLGKKAANAGDSKVDHDGNENVGKCRPSAEGNNNGVTHQSVNNTEVDNDATSNGTATSESTDSTDSTSLKVVSNTNFSSSSPTNSPAATAPVES